MTIREKNLAIILLSLVFFSICALSFQSYLFWRQKLDSSITKANLTIIYYKQALDPHEAGKTPKKSWQSGEAKDETFLERFSAVTQRAGWKLNSAFATSRDKTKSLFSVVLTGKSDSFSKLLESLSDWDRAVIINSIEATSSGKGNIEVAIEAGYENQ